MIKLLNILSELEVRKKDFYEPFREYMRNGSEGDFNIRDHYTEEELKNITKVPKWFTKVGGDLVLRYTPIISLPDNLEVGSILSLDSTKITSLPDNLRVGGTLFLFNTPLSEQYNSDTIRKMIEEKGGYVVGGVFV